jgi:hypothetical protein
MGWVDDATFWLRDHKVYPNTLTVRDFVCAVLAPKADMAEAWV